MIENRIYAHLSTINAITTVIGTRIYPVVMPQESDYPCITYQRISAIRINDLSGYSTLDNAQIQIDCWGTTYKGVKDLAAVIHTAMMSATGYKTVLNSDMDLVEPLDDKNVIYRVSQDYSCWNRE